MINKDDIDDNDDVIDRNDKNDDKDKDGKNDGDEIKLHSLLQKVVVAKFQKDESKLRNENSLKILKGNCRTYNRLYKIVTVLQKKKQ